jgi:hypothetical protein
LLPTRSLRAPAKASCQLLKGASGTPGGDGSACSPPRAETEPEGRKTNAGGSGTPWIAVEPLEGKKNGRTIQALLPLLPAQAVVVMVPLVRRRAALKFWETAKNSLGGDHSNPGKRRAPVEKRPTTEPPSKAQASYVGAEQAWLGPRPLSKPNGPVKG